MPVFHTKTIESILEPVAQQVSTLVVLHEDAGDGFEIPDIEQPMLVLTAAVENLIKVGRTTIEQCDDVVLRETMPAALDTVQNATRLLQQSAHASKTGSNAMFRKNLLDGSRQILQGTSDLLLCLDKSEVRKMVRQCNSLLKYLAVTEVIEQADALVKFVQDISTTVTNVFRVVYGRQKELTHQPHRDILCQCLAQIKDLTPVFFGALKLYVQLFNSDSETSLVDAAVNRTYLSDRLTDQVCEIIRVLQLTGGDDAAAAAAAPPTAADAERALVLKSKATAFAAQQPAATDWLRSNMSDGDSVGEKAFRAVLNSAREMTQLATSEDRAVLTALVDDMNAQLQSCERDRQAGKLSVAAAGALCSRLDDQLSQLAGAVDVAVRRADQLLQPPHQQLAVAATLNGRLEQVTDWLQQPERPAHARLGRQALHQLLAESIQLADQLGDDTQRLELVKLCRTIEATAAAAGDGTDRHQLAKITPQLVSQLEQLSEKLQPALARRLVEDFHDIHGPAKELEQAALTASDVAGGGEQRFQSQCQLVQAQCERVAATGRLVASCCHIADKQLAQAIQASAAEVESLCPQLIMASKIVSQNPQLTSAKEHFAKMQQQYTGQLTQLRSLSDEAVDAGLMVDQLVVSVGECTDMVEKGIRRPDSQVIVDNVTKSAKLSDRVLSIAKNEASNSNDAAFIGQIETTANQLENNLSCAIKSAKEVALEPHNHQKADCWRHHNNKLMSSVAKVGEIIRPDTQPPVSCLQQLKLTEVAPPRPPSPADERAPSRPPPPDTKSAESQVFARAPSPNQPIMQSAHNLHKEVDQWKSEDNVIVSNAKQMALLMARLSQLMRGESGNTRDFIACAKQIVTISANVTQAAKDLAHECTDKRLRSQMLQICERIPTIGTQLNILTTVKATMLGAKGTEEDLAATEMLVGNASNLMQAVKETVRAAEAASIKVRTDAGASMRWVRKGRWYE